MSAIYFDNGCVCLKLDGDGDVVLKVRDAGDERESHTLLSVPNLHQLIHACQRALEEVSE
jgi:hypothetical protein